MKVIPYTHIKNNLAKIFEMVKNGEEIIVSKNKGREKLAVILPYKKYKTDKERPLGILKRKASFKLKNDFKMTEQELLDS
ncbi:type II toxin-antitoxin system Phd/YefM family antitoxin [candidate division KSB1 bacterium]|nr:type II toxin-antitoxin system Phd/YefM family antitoxin [candidate division KSB1 bacterium]NIR68884.1 type II toxin-antitoxin system Phd/YefM family antitoxin [candidate division KSB1 bacterium]NIS27252.1 type II toxin-antitoxin system Phd/YefM family antitoxin [candidate division KSB1 bacterium]NIT74137.1 type II toxin-antitoxin system Phd/YefM family antitoxin [candidate division KSB1 bacterium]NIU27986.1 type II toxin-antitoxin system Phd/YefM family antitoxin [candidate division KSB1 ba